MCLAEIIDALVIDNHLVTLAETHSAPILRYGVDSKVVHDLDIRRGFAIFRIFESEHRKLDQLHHILLHLDSVGEPIANHYGVSRHSGSDSRGIYSIAPQIFFRLSSVYRF